ncbi:MAG: autotransporter-associated beta strand repeat-containing protein [Verrucomicrobiota bacterium]
MTPRFRSLAKYIRITTSLSAGALPIQMAHADTTWTGTNGQDWSNAGNWTNGVPLDASNNGSAFINIATGSFPVYSSGTTQTDWDVFVGDAGNSGRLDAAAGTLAIGNGNWMFVGTSGGTGTVNVTSSANLNAGAINIAAWTGGTSTGTVNVNTSGTINLTAGGGRAGFLDASLLVGEGGGGAKNGTFELQSGTVNTSFGTVLAYNTPGGGTANFNMSGGNFNNTGEFQVGRTGTAIVTHTAGILNSSAWVAIGRDSGSNGTYNLSGGTVNAATGLGFATVGSFGGSTGALNVSGTGIFNAANNSQILVGEGGTGTLNVSGTGLVTVNHATEGLRLGANSGGNGTVNLNGGTIQASLVTKGGGTGNFNFNGGTLKAAGNSATFMQGLTSANVQSGGAVIDSNGFNVTIGQALLNGGGGGGLTKQGGGTLTLSGVNTYTGATTITGGTLALGATGSINSTSGVSLGTGGTFDVSATGGYSVANLSGSGDVIGTLTITSQLAIGNSPGTSTFDNLTVGPGATYAYELVGGTNAADLGDVDGTLTLTGSVLDLSQYGAGIYTQGDEFTLFAYESLTGTFSGLADGDIFTDAGGQWQIDYNDSTAGLNGGTILGGLGSGFVTITAVPEPQAMLLGGLGLLALLRRRRNH